MQGKMMQTGKKDQPVYFEAPTVINTSGTITKTWADGAGNSPPEADFAMVITQRGQEAFEAGRTQTTGIIRVCSNYRADVLTTWRIKWLEQYYMIMDVDRSHQSKGELWCTARLVEST